MDSPAMNEGAVVDAGSAQMSFSQRLFGIYLEPTKTFSDISKKRTWVAMFVLMCIVTLISSYVLTARMDPADQAVKGLAMMKPIFKKFMSAEALAQMEDQAAKRAAEPRSFLQKVAPIVTTPIAMYIAYVILTTVFLLAFMITGAGLTFRKCFTTVVWGTGPPGILVALLSILFIFLKNPTDLEIAPINNVVSNLGPLVDFTTHPALNSLLSSVDIFSIWTACLLSIGFAAMSEQKLTAGKTAVTVVSLWVLWILLKVGFWAVLG